MPAGAPAFFIVGIRSRRCDECVLVGMISTGLLARTRASVHRNPYTGCMYQAPAWSKLIGSALKAVLKKAFALVSARSDKRRIRSSVVWWFDYDRTKKRFRGGRISRFDQN